MLGWALVALGVAIWVEHFYVMSLEKRIAILEDLIAETIKEKDGELQKQRIDLLRPR